MEKQWKEEHLLKLVGVVTKVEEKQKWKDYFARNHPEAKVNREELKWDQVAAKMPISLFVELNRHGPTRYEQLPVIYKRKFNEICEYFNDVFIFYDRNYCLSAALMEKLAEYSKGFLDQPFVSKTGPQAKLIKLDRETEVPENSASAVSADTASRVRERETEVPGDSASSVSADTASRICDSSGEVRHISNLDHHYSARAEAEVQVDAPLEQNSLKADRDDQRNLGLDRSYARQKSNAEVDTQQACLNDESVRFKEVEFVKTMSPSQVIKGFLLRLPTDFCTTNLAHYELENSVVFELVDKDGKRCKVAYLPSKRCLSAGWGTFAKQHGLQVDDTVRFRLVDSQTFQVKINEEAGEYETW